MIKPARQADIKGFKSVKSGGRERKYEEIGIRGAVSVRQVIVYRKKMKRYPPDTSPKMQEYYTYWYFTRPNKAKDGDDYERHVSAYQRAQKWLAEERETSPSTVGLDNITDIEERRRAVRP